MNKSNQKNFVLNLFTRTWVRDSHGLYDYESTQTKNLNAVLADSVIIARKKHDIKTVASIQDLTDEELLLNVKYEKQDKYTLENAVEYGMQPTEKNITDLSNKIWYVLRYDESKANQANQTIENTNGDYYLCKNDIIKLGRVKYALNEIHIPDKQDAIDFEDTCPNDEYNINSVNIHSQAVFDFIYKTKTPENTNPGDESNLCKYCYCDSNEPDNPLVHLCICAGGIRYAHYLCIKRWMETKLNVKVNEKNTVKSYNIKSFNCEICKTPYPFRFKVEDKDGHERIFDLINIERPDTNFIILESLNQMKESCNIKSIHVITLTGEVVTIGRGHDSDVRINDISVSRAHAWLKYDSNSGRLLLRDLKSKFGTLVLLKKPIEIKEKRIHLQIGRTYIEASLMGMAEFEKLKKEKKMKQHQQHDKDQQKMGSSMNNNNIDKNELMKKDLGSTGFDMNKDNK